jgi:hypothetical protein
LHQTFHRNRIKGTTSTFEVIDVVGDPNDGAPPNKWDVCGVTGATQDRTLIRKPAVYHGTGLDWDGARGTNADDCEWIVGARNKVDNIGPHTASDIFVSIFVQLQPIDFFFSGARQKKEFSGKGIFGQNFLIQQIHSKP